MAGVFNQANFNIRQQGQQFTGRLGRHQSIEPGKQVQLRPAKALQGFAGIQLRQQLQPGHQHRRRRGRRAAQEQPRQASRVRGALGAEQGKTLEGGSRITYLPATVNSVTISQTGGELMLNLAGMSSPIALSKVQTIGI